MLLWKLLCRIAALRAEVARLRTALREIDSCRYECLDAEQVADIARDVLTVRDRDTFPPYVVIAADGGNYGHIVLGPPDDRDEISVQPFVFHGPATTIDRFKMSYRYKEFQP
jgi:hypothetical protein